MSLPIFIYSTILDDMSDPSNAVTIYLNISYLQTCIITGFQQILCLRSNESDKHLRDAVDN